MSEDLASLQRDLRAFVAARDWARFHNAKDLALSVSVEAGELLEVFQWLGADEVVKDPAKLARAREEIADVYLYALLLAERLGFDLVAAARDKLGQNAEKYPVEKAHGSARKYTEF